MLVREGLQKLQQGDSGVEVVQRCLGWLSMLALQVVLQNMHAAKCLTTKSANVFFPSVYTLVVLKMLLLLEPSFTEVTRIRSLRSIVHYCHRPHPSSSTPHSCHRIKASLELPPASGHGDASVAALSIITLCWVETGGGSCVHQGVIRHSPSCRRTRCCVQSQYVRCYMGAEPQHGGSGWVRVTLHVTPAAKKGVCTALQETDTRTLVSGGSTRRHTRHRILTLDLSRHPP